MGRGRYFDRSIVHYCTTRSLITDPDQYSFPFDDLPNNIPTFCGPKRNSDKVKGYDVAAKELIGNTATLRKENCWIDDKTVP